MAAVTDKIKSVVDFFVKGFEPKDSVFDELDEDYMDDDLYYLDGLNVAYTASRPQV